MEKVHRKELLGWAFLPENNVDNTHHFSSINTVNPNAWRIKETKDAYSGLAFARIIEREDQIFF